MFVMISPAFEPVYAESFSGAIKGTYQTDPNFDPPDNPISNNSVSGIVSGSFIGIAVFEGYIVSDWSSYSPDYRCASVEGKIVIHGYYGDLTVYISGIQCEIWGDGVYFGINILIGSFEVAGGTGMYADASGAGEVMIIIQAFNQEFNGQFVGDIEFG
jgi:hypothetical protein